MVGKKYTAEFKVQMVEEYLNGPKRTKADFALEKGISDSTFNDWVLKYQKMGNGFCNVTTEIANIGGITVVDPMVCNPQPHNEMPIEVGENMMRLYYNGASIDFNVDLLDRVMGVLKSW